MSPGTVSARGRLALLAAILVPVGVATKLYTGPGAALVGGYLGGSVYVAFWCLVVLAIRPQLPVEPVAVAVFSGTACLEFLQLWHPSALEAARSTLAGQALLGSHFAWADFPFYALGAAAVVPLARMAKGGAWLRA